MNFNSGIFFGLLMFLFGLIGLLFIPLTQRMGKVLYKFDRKFAHPKYWSEKRLKRLYRFRYSTKTLILANVGGSMLGLFTAIVSLFFF